MTNQAVNSCNRQDGVALSIIDFKAPIIIKENC